MSVRKRQRLDFMGRIELSAARRAGADRHAEWRCVIVLIE
jgi:hypothetical protein